MDAEIQKAIQQFAVKYDLLSLMTALPTTLNFTEYEAVYLPKKHFIREETMSTEDYLDLFFPFEKPDAFKRGIESMWNIQNDRVMVALAMTMSDEPMAVNMSFQREYAEYREWMKQSMASFGGIAPTYHIALLDKLMIVWDFYSMLLGVQMIFSFMLTDRDYLVMGSEVHIDMYDDRLEIYSSGGMYRGKPIQECGLDEIDYVRRNPVIADLFHCMKFMERRGSGIKKILVKIAKLPGYTEDLKPTFHSTHSSSCASRGSKLMM